MENFKMAFPICRAQQKLKSLNWLINACIDFSFAIQFIYYDVMWRVSQNKARHGTAEQSTSLSYTICNPVQLFYSTDSINWLMRLIKCTCQAIYINLIVLFARALSLPVCMRAHFHHNQLLLYKFQLPVCIKKWNSKKWEWSFQASRQN